MVHPPDLGHNAGTKRPVVCPTGMYFLQHIEQSPQLRPGTIFGVWFSPVYREIERPIGCGGARYRTRAQKHGPAIEAPWYASNSFQLQNDGAFRNGWCSRAGITRVFSNPIPCHPYALLDASLVLED